MAKRATKPRHDWREDAREIAIVIIGVFIALVAQEVVQKFEWKQRVSASEQAIRHELLDDDGPEVYQRVALHPCAQAQLQLIRDAVEAERPRGEIAGLVTGFKAVFVTYDRVAYDTTIAQQVSTHMDQDELDRFTVPYTVLPAMDFATRQEAADLARLRGIKHSGGPLGQAEQSQLLAAAEALRNDDNMIYAAAMTALPSIRKVGPINPQRIHFYMGIARSAYGSCVKDVPPGWPD